MSKELLNGHLRLPEQRAQQHTHPRFLRALGHKNVKSARLGNLCGSLEHLLAMAVARFNAHNNVAGVAELPGEPSPGKIIPTELML